MKNIFPVIAILITIATRAQVTKVYLQASGLTCSMCSNAINKALRTLDFIDEIDADIKTYTFKLSFKAGSNVDFDKIKKKVEDAGFSVAGFIAAIYFNNVRLKANLPVTIGSSTLYFVNPEDRALDGEIKVRLLDKGFVSPKEYKSNLFSKSLTESGIYHVSI